MTDLTAWRSKARSRSAAERVRAAKRPPSRAAFDDIRPDLQALLADADDLVRTEAADTLGYYDEPAARRLLKKRLRIEHDRLVRHFLLQSLAMIGSGPEVQEFDRLRATREKVDAHLGLAVTALTEATFDLSRSLSGRTRRPRPIEALVAFGAYLPAVLNRIADALVVIDRFAAATKHAGEREVAQTLANTLRNELRHVTDRTKKGNFRKTSRRGAAA